ncbi:MAG TPA: Lrp/AsnC family transcriptional regulator [Candidatus Nanoarchaeia archaeon]|nr:Lrp/AsnC family transcriptional regulator [Candidatus Nanoarchaeia archaeon]
MVKNIDIKDAKILVELDRDARQSNMQIGRRVGLSKEVVKYRIDNMVERGVILRFHTVVNYFRLGMIKFKLYLRLTNASKEKMEEIAEYFHRHNKTEWVVLTTGRWDVISGFIVNNVNEFDDEVQAVLQKFAQHIQEKAITTTLYLAHQTREFLKTSKTGVPRVVHHTTKDRQEHIDSIDKEILRLIVNNARMPIVEMARRIHVTPRIVQYRIREMEKKKIILAYKAHVDPRKMGKVFGKMIVYLANVNKERLHKFISYASLMPGAVWPQRVLGDWDFELDVEVADYDSFQQIIAKLKEEFPDIIKDHDFCMVSREYKLDLLSDVYPQFSGND